RRPRVHGPPRTGSRRISPAPRGPIGARAGGSSALVPPAPPCCSATRSTGPRRRRRRRSWRPWPKARSAWTARRTRCRSRSSCWRPTTRSSTRAPTRCRKRSLTGSSPGSGWATWMRRVRGGMPGAGRRRAPRPPRPAEILDAGTLIAMRESLEQVHLDDDLLGYVVRLVAATRSHPQVTVGASPRGTLAVIQLARGHAALDSRDYVIPEDVKAVAVPALAHRLVLRPPVWVRSVTGADLIREILAAEPVPRASP